MRKVIDVTGESPVKRKRENGLAVDVPGKKVIKKKTVETKPVKVKKKEEVKVKKKQKPNKAETVMAKVDTPKPKKKSKKKKSVAILLSEDRDQALIRLETHAAMAGVIVHPDDLAGVTNPEAVFLLTYQKIFRRLRKFSGKMEKSMGKKGTQIQSRDVYALNVLYNQTREVMADMRSLIDMSTLAETLCVEALDPMAKTAAQAVTTMLMTVQSTLRTIAPKHLEAIMEELKKSGSEIGTELNNQLQSSRGRLNGILTQSR